MLVLIRKKGQSITIGDDITITIIDIPLSPHGNPQVRIGIDAPQDVPILRDDAIKQTPRDRG